MHVIVSNSQKDIRISSKAITKAIEALAAFKRVKCQEIAIHLVTKRKITQLHDQFFQDPTPTDCISFPLDNPQDDSETSILGEIFVCPRVAIEYAEKNGLDPRRELFLYLVHGFLHLLGYDDLDPASRRTMRRQEALCMAHLGTMIDERKKENRA